MAWSKATGRWSGLLVASVVFVTFTRPVLAQTADPLAEQQRAESLEQKGRWLEAAEIYATLARQQPAAAEWTKRAKTCRVQDQITRRYTDRQFLQKSLQVSFETAGALYAEVLGKIQNHYVEEVSLNRLLNQGLDNLDLALQNPAFRQAAFAVTVPEETLEAYRATLQERRNSLTATSRREAVQKAKAVAIGLQQDLGATPTAVLFEFICAACEALDDYSAYLQPERYSLEKAAGRTDAVGIGVELREAAGQVLIAALIPEGPAAKAGVQQLERLVRIDGLVTQNLGLEESALRLLGKEGSRVRIEVQGIEDKQPRGYDLIRQKVSAASITKVIMADADAGIGYIHLGYFQSSTLQELDQAIAKLTPYGLRALILDLRKNPGGLFDSAVQVADRFISDGVIVSTQGRSFGTSVVYRAQNDNNLALPLVVLVDGETASAAELLAMALKDHRRAMLVGQKTFGKGCLQYVYPLQTLPAGLRLTAARYFSPLNLPIQDQGILPDVLWPEAGPMPMNMEMMMSVQSLEEAQFDRALEIARELLSKM